MVVDGITVVDLHGGFADRGRTRPWRADTLVNTFSVGKALLAVLAVQSVGRGLLEADHPVSDHWPEFALAGKGEITVRQLLSHQAGLPALRRRLAPGAMLDWSLMTRTLAAEAPWWSPGTAHGYHVNTFGFLVGELVRRVTGRPPATALRDEVAGPLGADVHLGLRRHEHHRVAEVLWPGEPPAEQDPPDLVGIELMIHNAYFNPSGLSGAGVVNTPAWREAVIPSTNLHASARGVALVYQALVAVLSRGGTGLVDRSALAEAVTEQVSGVDLVLGRSSRFGLGFQLTQPDRPLGPGPAAFGHFGAGGSLGFCDPDAGVAFGYVMNHLGPRWQNPRNRALIDAVFESLV